MSDELPKKCECTIGTPCTINKCDCEAFCSLYERQVAGFQNKKYFTVSPDTKNYHNSKTLISDWNDMFTKMCRHCTDILVVLELAGGVRPHFHCIADVPNTELQYFSNTLMCWGNYNNVRLHAEFTKGFHYMFKDVQYTYKCGHTPILEREDFISIYNGKVAKRKEELKRIKNEEAPDEPKYKDWMINI